MLPKIISNFTLAFIAIIVVYMLAPLFRDIFGGIFNPHKLKKKSHSKEEFDEMVKRKIERLSVTGQKTSAIQSNANSTGNRTFLSYFEEKDLFASQEDQKFFQGLISSLQWGDFPGQDTIIQMLKKDFNFNNEEICAKLNSSIKEVFNKKHLLHINKISNKKLSKNSFQSFVCIYILSHGQDQFQHKRYSSEIFNFLISFMSEDDKISILESYINGEENSSCINIDKSYEEFISELNKTYDELFPILKIDTDKIRSEFEAITDKDQRKKKYKKQAQVFHPDKWHNKLRSPKIDERLNENFNSIKEIYNSLI